VFVVNIVSSLDGFCLVDDSKRRLNEEHFEKFATSAETILRETPKRADLPSVTNILNLTMSEKSKAALENWKKNMIEKLGEDGFKKYSGGRVYFFYYYCYYFFFY